MVQQMTWGKKVHIWSTDHDNHRYIPEWLRDNMLSADSPMLGHILGFDRHCSTNLSILNPLIPSSIIYIYICWFNFDALAQGNAYKPTRELMNYRGPNGDRTHYLQTEATLPAANCRAHWLHTTEIVSKNTIPMTCKRLHWTIDTPSGMHTCQYVNQISLSLHRLMSWHLMLSIH